MQYKRSPIEIESPEEYGYGNIKNNLSESSYTDQTLHSLNLKLPDLTLLYTEHRGNSNLRSLIAADSGVEAKDVLVTAGAAGALFIVATSQLSASDHLVVIRPNYATNIETPRAIGCEISFIDLAFENAFQPDVKDIEAAIKPNTRLISITCPHNPTGTNISSQTLKQIVSLTKDNNCLLLVDETYREIFYGNKLPVAASLGSHVISVTSLSKSYGVPGIRLGWIITTNAKLQEVFLAAKEQISISGSVIDEWVAEQVLSRKQEILTHVNTEMAQRLMIVEKWIGKEELLEWVKPAGGMVCFPRMKQEPPGGTVAFYERLLKDHGTYVGPGHWFEMPDTYFRIGFGWPAEQQLHEGLRAISSALRNAR